MSSRGSLLSIKDSVEAALSAFYKSQGQEVTLRVGDMDGCPFAKSKERAILERIGASMFNCNNVQFLLQRSADFSAPPNGFVPIGYEFVDVGDAEDQLRCVELRLPCHGQMVRVGEKRERAPLASIHEAYASVRPDLPVRVTVVNFADRVTKNPKDPSAGVIQFGERFPFEHENDFEEGEFRELKNIWVGAYRPDAIEGVVDTALAHIATYLFLLRPHESDGGAPSYTEVLLGVGDDGLVQGIPVGCGELLEKKLGFHLFGMAKSVFRTFPPLHEGVRAEIDVWDVGMESAQDELRARGSGGIVDFIVKGADESVESDRRNHRLLIARAKFSDDIQDEKPGIVVLRSGKRLGSRQGARLQVKASCIALDPAEVVRVRFRWPPGSRPGHLFGISPLKFAWGPECLGRWFDAAADRPAQLAHAGAHLVDRPAIFVVKGGPDDAVLGEGGDATLAGIGQGMWCVVRVDDNGDGRPPLESIFDTMARSYLGIPLTVVWGLPEFNNDKHPLLVNLAALVPRDAHVIVSVASSPLGAAAEFARAAGIDPAQILPLHWSDLVRQISPHVGDGDGGNSDAGTPSLRKRISVAQGFLERLRCLGAAAALPVAVSAAVKATSESALDVIHRADRRTALLCLPLAFEHGFIAERDCQPRAVALLKSSLDGARSDTHPRVRVLATQYACPASGTTTAIVAAMRERTLLDPHVVAVWGLGDDDGAARGATCGAGPATANRGLAFLNALRWLDRAFAAVVHTHDVSLVREIVDAVGAVSGEELAAVVIVYDGERGEIIRGEATVLPSPAAKLSIREIKRVADTLDPAVDFEAYNAAQACFAAAKSNSPEARDASFLFVLVSAMIRGCFEPLKRLAKRVRSTSEAEGSDADVVGWALTSLFGRDLERGATLVVRPTDATSGARALLLGFLARDTHDGPSRLAHPLVGFALVQAFLGSDVLDLNNEMVPYVREAVVAGSPRADKIFVAVVMGLKSSAVAQGVRRDLLCTRLGDAELSNLLSWVVSVAGGLRDGVPFALRVIDVVQRVLPVHLAIVRARLRWLLARHFVSEGELDAALAELGMAIGELEQKDSLVQAERGRGRVVVGIDGAHLQVDDAPVLVTHMQARIHYTRGHVSALLNDDNGAQGDYAVAMEKFEFLADIECASSRHNALLNANYCTTEVGIRSRIEKGHGIAAFPRVKDLKCSPVIQ